eukprot:TRINITY_DN1013_c0_g1_i1.p2 TRINITY_DN1013_c0_g1~~TRINITY_DN1013_c0_g1_i1.p2  ORF type:complete len:107 (-),score=20.09 TRINITY_DN1013_c0_g1_i1:114-434(-)
MKFILALAALVAIAAADISFYSGSSCGGDVQESLPSDTCTATEISWAGASINSVESNDLGSSWRFAANLDGNCNDVFVEANLVKDCIEISPPFEFASGNYASMKYN